MNLKLKLCNERQLGMAMRIRQHAPTGGYMRIAQICGYMGNGHVKIIMRNAHAHVSGLINGSIRFIYDTCGNMYVCEKVGAWSSLAEGK